MDMKLEVVVVPVADVDRAKDFYAGLGWRLDADVPTGENFRVVQVTPPGSPASVIFGTNVTAQAPGSAQGLHLIVDDIEAARDELKRGVLLSRADLASALRRAAAAHGEHEARTGAEDPELPDWYARYMVGEQAGSELPR